ncbi:hypothetical protein M422DRAFT_63477 [Sphaerobolus stellatus SS14]|nr:hypothetical protein M422DRAFT_63477 [Sphaerobolus stellatus SS14]
MAARKSLAQQIAELENPTPVDFDPEDFYGGNANENKVNGEAGDVEMANEAIAGREHYVEVGPSALRKLQDSVADPKYDGVRTSRSKIFGDEDDEEAEGGDEDAEESDGVDGPPSLHGDSMASEDDEMDQDEDDEGSEDDEGELTKSSKRKSAAQQDDDEGDEEAEALTQTLQRTRIVEKQKGRAVKQQLRIWDTLVDARIRLQKSVVSANKLPHPDIINSYTTHEENRAVVDEFLSEALKLSEDILELRRTLLEKAEMNPPARKKRKIAEELESEDVDFEKLVNEGTADMMDFAAQAHPTTLSILQKWSAKVQAVAPAALLTSNRISFKTGAGSYKSAGELVDEALRDSERWIKKTRIAGKGVRLGASKEGGEEKEGEGEKEEDEDEVDEETFDDREFYQSMLRDVIESKGGKDVVQELYSNRQKKKKKPVDTRASKGRKIRYEPHEKLLNFMVPVPVRGMWHEEQIDELFASLLGRGFEGKAVDGKAAKVQEEATALQGFRLFG